MAREKAHYIEVEEFPQMVRKLIDLNPEKFGHIDPLVLRMVAITNKEPSYVWKVQPVKNPVAIFCKDVRFIVKVFQSIWETYSEDQKGLVILDMLLSLEPDEEEPKIIPFNLSDHADMIKTFGVNYLDNPEIRNLFGKSVEWI